MKIKFIDVEIPKKTKEKLKVFFEMNQEWLETNNMLDYQNIKVFGDLLEKFMLEHNLKSDIFFKLFLTEIRSDQLAYRIVKMYNNEEWTKLEAGLDWKSNREIRNSVILRWRNECMNTGYLEELGPARKRKKN